MPCPIPILLAAVILVGCAPTPTPVPLQADPSQVSQLNGRWEGNYSSEETGRSGSIVFTLVAGSDTATGDVLMVPSNTRVPLQPAPRAKPSQQQNLASPEVLTIRFVRFKGNEVRGELVPYRAPDCDCTLETTFTGTLKGDRIEGVFTTFGGPGPAPSTGRWQVWRKR